MLMLYGNTTVAPSWEVIEKIPPGYSRVYYIYGGEVVYTDDSCRKCLKTGYLYIFPSAAAYAMLQNPENPLVCTYLHIDLFPILTTGAYRASRRGREPA